MSNPDSKKKLQTWCSDEEFLAFKKKAEQRGLNVSQALKALASQFIGGDIDIKLPSERLKSLEKEVEDLKRWKDEASKLISQRLGELAA